MSRQEQALREIAQLPQHWDDGDLARKNLVKAQGIAAKALQADDVDKMREGAINLAFAVAADAMVIAQRLRKASKPENIRKAHEGIREAHRGVLNADIPWENER